MVASTFCCGSNSAHAAADAAHAPRVVRGLFALAAAGGKDQVRVLRLLHFLQALLLHGRVDVLLRYLCQDGVADFVLVVGAPGIRVELREAWRCGCS